MTPFKLFKNIRKMGQSFRAIDCAKRSISLQEVWNQQLPNTLSALGIARKGQEAPPLLPFSRTYRAVKSALSHACITCVLSALPGTLVLIPPFYPFRAIAYTRSADRIAPKPIADPPQSKPADIAPHAAFIAAIAVAAFLLGQLHERSKNRLVLRDIRYFQSIEERERESTHTQ
jgi:hypothetical protein